MQRISIQTESLSPTLIRTYAYNLEKSDWSKGFFPNRIVETYEFEFIVESEGFMNLEGIRHPLHAGDLCLRRPGERTMGERPYSCYMISFSLLGNPVHISTPLPSYTNELLDKIPPVLATKNPKYYQLLFQKILKQYIKSDEATLPICRSLILEILCSAYLEAKHFTLPSSAYQRIVSEAIDYMESHHFENLSLSSISDRVNFSAGHFQKVFKDAMGISPTDYLLRYRIEKAKEKLLLSNDSITEVALSCGFESTSYFCHRFKTETMFTPGTYRKSHQRP